MINSNSKVNIITPTYVAKLMFNPQKTSVRAQKIDDLPLKICKIAQASFLIPNYLKKVWFLGETFLLTDISMKLIVKMFFLLFSITNIQFTQLKKLIWRFYGITEALTTNNWVKLIDKKAYARVTLNKNSETFLIYIIALEATWEDGMITHFSQISQIVFLQ